MKSREELKKQHEHLLQVYEKVKERLAGYPNVVSIGIGMKEKDGQLTNEGCIKIVVKEKVSEADLDPDEIIPKEIEGVKTDVIVQPNKIPLAACTEDQANYRPIKGGIRINNYRNGGGVGGSGTLGCVAQRVSDDSWVILSNHHVLYGDSGQDGDVIGQPWVGCSWCCKSNVIAENVAKDRTLDCAIAKVKDDIAIENTILDVGNIALLGVAPAVLGEAVRKKGARTGLTSGTISFIDGATKEITITPGAAGGPSHHPGGCTNYVSGRTIFAYGGDSGSVIVNDDSEVVALLYAIDAATESLGFANDILQIQTTLNIRIKTTSSVPGRTPAFQSSTEIQPVQPGTLDDGWLDQLEDKLEETITGRTLKQLFRTHEQEIFNLVNRHRTVTVTWHRKQGPAFLAALGRSVKHPEYEIPQEINNISLQNLLMSMATVLEEFGSEPLRQDVRRYAVDVVQLSKQCSSAEEFFKLIKQLDDEAVIERQIPIH